MQLRPTTSPFPPFPLFPLWLLALLSFSAPVAGMGLVVASGAGACPLPQVAATRPPPQAANRLAESKAAPGQRNIAWAWLGSPTRRYPHPALGSTAHAGSLHVLARSPLGKLQALTLTLPLNRVFEDRIPRLVDLDGDGLDEILLIESDLLKGSALVVYGVQPSLVGTQTSATTGPQQALPAKAFEALELHELARSPPTGSTFRWLNPIGVADFDGDGHLDIASVTAPHVGGVLTLYHYRPQPGRPPHAPGTASGQLVPFASVMDVSNHKMGALEQEVATIVTLPGQRPAIIVPDMTLTALHAFRWESPGQWKELADVKPLPARIERIEAAPGGACIKLADQSWRAVVLTP